MSKQIPNGYPHRQQEVGGMDGDGDAQKASQELRKVLRKAKEKDRKRIS